MRSDAQRFRPPIYPQTIHDLVTGITAAAASNTARIQAALNQGGSVIVVPKVPGTVWINDQLIVPPNTTFKIAEGSTLKMVDGINKSLVVNRAFTAAFSSVTLAWTAGNTATVTWADHGRSVGDYLWIRGVPGTAQSQYFGVFMVTAISGNDLTILLKRRPTAAPAGTFEAKLADANIFVSGSFDFNSAGNNAPAGPNKHALVFGGVRSLTVKDLTVQNTVKYCLCLGAVTDFKVENVHSPNAASDGIKIYGPAFDGVVDGVSGKFVDDVCSLQPQESASYSEFDYTKGGDILNVDVKNLSGQTAASIFAIYSSQYQYANGITIDGITGISTTTAPIIKFYVGVGYSGCQVGEVVIRRVGWETSADKETIVFDGNQTYRRVVIENFQSNMSAGVSGLTKSPILFNSGTVVVLDIKGLQGYLNSNIPCVNFQGTAVANVINIEDYTLYGNSTGQMINLGGTGTVRSVRIANGQTYTMSRIVVVGSGMTSVPNITIEGGDINAAAVVEANAACLINFRSGNRMTSSTSTVRVNGTVAVTIECTGSTITGGTWLTTSGSPTITVRSDVFQADVTTLARTNGARVYNTNASAGTLGAAGVVVCDGTGAAGSWKLLTNPTLNY